MSSIAYSLLVKTRSFNGNGHLALAYISGSIGVLLELLDVWKLHSNQKLTIKIYMFTSTTVSMDRILQISRTKFKHHYCSVLTMHALTFQRFLVMRMRERVTKSEGHSDKLNQFKYARYRERCGGEVIWMRWLAFNRTLVMNIKHRKVTFSRC